jgi:hypothetical protein
MPFISGIYARKMLQATAKKTTHYNSPAAKMPVRVVLH